MRSLLRDCRGITMVEYALIAGLVSLVALSVVAGVGSKIKSVFSAINTSLASA